MTFTSVPRFTSNPCYQLAQEDTPRSQVSAAKAKKAATFGALSVCANRRLPSRVSIRSCTVNICPSVRGGDRLRTPWTFNPRMRSSQARVERFSTSRARSIRIPTASSAIPSADFQRLGDPPRLNASASVPQGLSSVAPDLTSPSLLSTSGPLPVVSTLGRPSPSESRHPSLMARARRSPSSSRYPEMHVNSSATEYTVDISLPIAIKSEMVTISTARGGKVKIVADAWHLEVDCHFEWEIVFPPHDVDLASIRANFEKGRLVVSAGRRSCKA